MPSRISRILLGRPRNVVLLPAGWRLTSVDVPAVISAGIDAVRPSAYGIYLLHFIFLIWLQYIVYDPAFPAFVKFAIVFTGTLSMSWALTVMLRKIPVVARMI